METRRALADHLRKLRTERGWTHVRTVARLGSSQSRVAKMEAADGSVSLDLLIKALLALSASAADNGRVIAMQPTRTHPQTAAAARRSQAHSAPSPARC